MTWFVPKNSRYQCIYENGFVISRISGFFDLGNGFVLCELMEDLKNLNFKLFLFQGKEIVRLRRAEYFSEFNY